MRKVNTFDIFDSLVARRCVLPELIFDEVEKLSGFEGFLNYRVQAEASISSQNYTLDDIYSNLANRLNLSVEKIRQLQELEIKQELENAIPIQSNLDKVTDGDVLITDMYLPRHVIELILKKVGLNKQVGVIVSSHGKSSGRIWPKISSILSISTHYGDNAYSDIEKPMEFGVYGEILKQSALSTHESSYAEHGLKLLSRVMRECRLKISSAQFSREQNMRYLLQINYNMPILMLACVHLYLTASKEQLFKFLFSSRDCYAMEQVFNTLVGGAGFSFESSYFLTSRVSRTAASDAYVRYANSIFDKNSVVVDLCGTGLSLAKLFRKTKASPCVYFIQYLQHFVGVEDVSKIKNLKYIISDKNINNVFAELVNYNKQGMLLDVSDVDGFDSLLPEFESTDYPASVNNAVNDIINAQNIFLGVLSGYDCGKIFDEISNFMPNIPWFINKYYKEMSRRMHCMQDVMDYHVTQDEKTVWRLSKIG